MFNKTIAAITLSLAINTTTMAHDPNKQIEVLIQNVDIVLLLIGATQYYTEECAPLTPTGEFYIEIAINAHNINHETIKDYEQFKKGYNIAKTYPSCKSILKDFTFFGIDHLVIQTDKEGNNIQPCTTINKEWNIQQCA